MQKFKIRTITAVGMLTALSIVLTRFLVPISTDTLRFSLGNIPIILAGIISPLAGGICGALSDIIGCFFGGYAPFIPLTLSAVAVGVLPSVLLRASEKFLHHGRTNLAIVSIVMVITNLLTSILWSTLCLHWLTGAPFTVLFLSRLPVNSLRTVAEIAILFIIFKSRVLERTGAYRK